MGKVVATWRATQELAHIHWLASSLGGGALLTTALEIATDAPLEFTLPIGVLIACALAVVLNAIPALKADAEFKRVRAAHFSTMSEERAKRRAALIAAARQKISEYDGHEVGGFLPWIEKTAEFYEIRPHLNKVAMNSAWEKNNTIVIHPGRGVVDTGKAVFAQEVDRLAREWKVD